jgi:hypothetical protein
MQVENIERGMWPANGYNPPQWPKTSPTGWRDEKPLERTKEGTVLITGFPMD